MAEADRAESADTMLTLLYASLRELARAKIARENPGHTLQPTALVHEAYLKLVDGSPVHWESPRHFFAAAAQAMRRILIDRARRAHSLKRGGDLTRISGASLDLVSPELNGDLLALDRALRQLELQFPRQAKVVELRYFAGLSIEETAELLGVAAATVKREWTFARAWLSCAMDG